KPVTLLKDRSAETLSSWLKEHPGIKIVSRDRARAYEKGIKEGAPEAIQVADRFHLLQNLAQTLYEVFGTHNKEFKEVEKIRNQSSVIKDEENIVVSTTPTLAPAPTKQQKKAEQRRTRRFEKYQKIWELHSQGWSAKAIAKKLGIGCTTVFRCLRNPTFIERRGRSDKGRSLVTPYQDYIIKRWNEGCRETKILFEEIKQQGFSGSYTTVSRYTTRLRECQGLKKRQRYSTKRLPKIIKASKKPLTPYSAAWLILGNSDVSLISKSEQEELIMLLKAQSPSLKEGIELAQKFISLVRQKKVWKLDSWLKRAYNSTILPFKRFAKSLFEDYSAVKAAITMSWSNGPVEGQINRLKMLKRQMYGRAKLDLLTRRFLLQI
ncbi:MAG: transposase, partial [Cyanobacteria bacterium P01_D01_bin.50]